MRKQTSSERSICCKRCKTKRKKNISGPRAMGPQILAMPPFWLIAILLLWASRKLYRAYVPMP